MSTPTRSTIMDTNSFRSEHAAGLDPAARGLTQRRERVLGGSYRLFYRRPVHLVRGEGQYLFDADGRRYLDLYNNVASIGHCHPAVVEAVTAQLQQLNTHTRYLHETILDYTDEILATLPAVPAPGTWKAMYQCTGSEANDLAVRVAREFSGNLGVIATSEAYHGTSDLTSGFSPALGSGQPLAPTTRLVPAPDAYRQGLPPARLGPWFADRVREAVASLQADGFGVAAFIADSVFSSDGVLPGRRGFLAEAVDVVRAAGGVFIADEVQPGFARTGEEFWGFARHGLVPELVTTGKPMGNGIPVSGLFAREDVLRAFSDRVPYFNTFGGNPVSMAAARAVLRVLREEGLQEHALEVGARFRDALDALAVAHEAVGDVRGVGLFTGLELVTDRSTREPDRDLALAVLEELRERGVLTSVAGPHGNVLKLRPPLVFAAGDVDTVVRALDESLTALGA
ncbi:aspartate aminotransferase family protein [Kineococcus rhizosphaerae]|uniref:4-aminobutyrate aminotransferase-like enzyme n=1 Tax=Kineococcus rhizosphaerae TaxID=559628 RepID=A0A2T0RBP8_9ACTN|nr:aspartate aminotransferase family protein [Kineococcus rhizosphaerae]PRY18560.1 4-aminobutyrate aminotransferase-like enzyme [Kineococcus rhizosphaerae]